MTKRQIGYILIVFVAVLYSMTETALKFLLSNFAPLQLSVERTIFGAICLLPLSIKEYKTRKIKIEKYDFLVLCLAGFLSVTLYMAFNQIALITEDASAVSTIFCSNSIFAVFFAHFLIKEPIHKNNVISLIVVLIAILVILNPKSLEMTVFGFCMCLVSTLSFSVFGSLTKDKIAKYGSVVVGNIVLGFGSLCLLVLVLFGRTGLGEKFFTCLRLTPFVDVPLLTGLPLELVPWFILVSTILAGGGYVLNAKIVELTSATEYSFVFMLKPIFVPIVAILVLDEVITTNRIIGIVLFLIASSIAIIPSLRKAK